MHMYVHMQQFCWHTYTQYHHPPYYVGWVVAICVPANVLLQPTQSVLPPAPSPPPSLPTHPGLFLFFL